MRDKGGVKSRSGMYYKYMVLRIDGNMDAVHTQCCLPAVDKTTRDNSSKLRFPTSATASTISEW
jgi:hypothetical protein